MPGMDGPALTRLIRQHQAEPVVILGLTANAWPEERTRCRMAGMDDCLFKPLQLPQLEAILSDVMKSKQAALAEPAGLDKLVNIEKLKTMSSHDGGMLGELLRLTLQSNEEDLRLAEDLFSLQDWPELASCAHRISGAVQICGAERAENACRNLEVACREAVVDEFFQRQHIALRNRQSVVQPFIVEGWRHSFYQLIEEKFSLKLAYLQVVFVIQPVGDEVAQFTVVLGG
ncbi:Sensor protein evgS [Beauveria bassiana D1-5]|uniref:Sensor protein evgS n=1 Tax=Beauveria bassiana D1-5 TaxID=1245745 RepID=A0A0A2WJC8_BEABA|nr:Sensor protein evgS [Beauveria bassiana D1-5]